MYPLNTAQVLADYLAGARVKADATFDAVMAQTGDRAAADTAWTKVMDAAHESADEWIESFFEREERNETTTARIEGRPMAGRRSVLS